MVGLPAATPVTAPVDASTVAKAVLELAHVPPVISVVSVLLSPTHVLVVPPRVAVPVLFIVTYGVTAALLVQPVPG
jgi:hypothetical protein